VRKDLLRAAGDDEFAFRHRLVRDAAYASLPKAARAVLHERAAAWVDDVDELAGVHLELAHGYRVELGERGDEVDALAVAAAARLVAAGEEEYAREATRAALSLFERAVALDPTGDALVLLAETRAVRGDFTSARETADRAIALAEANGDELLALRARAAGFRATMRLERDTHVLRPEADALVEGFSRHGDERGLARAHALVAAVVHWLSADAAGTAEAARRSIELARRVGDAETEARGWRALLGAALFGPGHVDEGIALCRETVERYGERRPLTTATAVRAWAGLAAMRGEFETARTLLDRDRALVADLGVRTLRMHTAEVATWVELRAGDAVAAEAAARDGLAIAEEFDDRLTYAEFASLVARALERQERDDEVLALTAAAEERTQGGDVAVEVQWRIARAPALLRAGQTAEAERLAREAVQLASATDFVPLRADALTCLGRVTGSADTLAEACDLYDRKGDVAGKAQVFAAEGHLNR
jgi:tetratricopeptide (TPR) repeat protein